MSTNEAMGQSAPPGRMPVAFFGHGTPMNALGDNRYSRAWAAFGASVPRPRAILMISAHWYLNATALTAMARPRTIHDFYGFPDELFAVEYPAPGDPELAAEIAEVLQPFEVGLDAETWGLDHGAWSVLVHAFPDADVPVIQLSINAAKPFDHHLALGIALAPLRDRGILIAGSGNVVHHLGMVDWSQPDAGADWAQRFDDDAAALLLSDPADVVGLQSHSDYDLAAPTPEHFIPLLYFAGCAVASGETPEVLVDGYAYGSLSMASYVLGGGPDDVGGPGEERLPVPEVPADDANI